MLKFRKLSDDATAPTKGSSQAAGVDLYSAYHYILIPDGSVTVLTDLSISVPPGTYGRIAPRSGLATKYLISVGAGVIDADYRGNIGVVLFNHGVVVVEITPGQRIAQLICEKIVYPEIIECPTLEETVRGERGFGSTGN